MGLGAIIRTIALVQQKMVLILQPEENDYLKNITKISVGEVHSLALDKDGNVWTWGNNDYSRLGRKTVPDWKPTKLNDLKILLI